MLEEPYQKICNLFTFYCMKWGAQKSKRGEPACLMYFMQKGAIHMSLYSQVIQIAISTLLWTTIIQIELGVHLISLVRNILIHGTFLQPRKLCPHKKLYAIWLKLTHSAISILQPTWSKIRVFPLSNNKCTTLTRVYPLLECNPVTAHST